MGKLALKVSIYTIQMLKTYVSFQGEGDVCIMQEYGDCKEVGVVTYVINSQRVGACVESFGFLESYLACYLQGMPKLHSITPVL